MSNNPPYSTYDISSSLWKAFDTIRGYSNPSLYKKYILTIVFLKMISDIWKEKFDIALERYSNNAELAKSSLEIEKLIIPEGSSFYDLYLKRDKANIGEEINRTIKEIEFANYSLKDLFDGVDFTSKVNLGEVSERNEKVRMLLDLVYNLPFISDSEHSSGDGFYESVYESIMGQFSKMEGSYGGQFSSPKSLVELSINLINPEDGMSVFDPAVGTGRMLIEANNWINKNKGFEKKIHLYGQDINFESTFVARMNMLFHRLWDGIVWHGDSLTNPMNLEGDQLKKFDLILSSPPFSLDLREETISTLSKDQFGRFQFGIPNRFADLLFIQHIIASLKENGRAVVIVPSRILFASGNEGEIRGKIIESDLIESVISLGPGLLANTTLPVNVLVINKNKSSDRKGKIVFIDASSEYERGEQSTNRINHVQREKISKAFISANPLSGFSAVTTIAEVKQKEYSLLPSRYIELFDKHNFLGGNVRWVKLSHIADLMPGTTSKRAFESEGDIPVIRSSDLSSPKINLDELRKTSAPLDKSKLQNTVTGDVLISKNITTPFRSYLVDDDLNGVMVDQNIYIIRLKQEYQRYRQYIVEFFRSNKGNSLLSTFLVGTLVPQLRFSDLREISIPLPEEPVVQLLTSLHNFEEELINRIEKTKKLRVQLFGINNAELVQRNLDELSTEAHILSSSLVQADSLDYQVRNFYPFPLAYTYRSISSIIDPVQKYPEQLRVAENMLVFLAITGLSVCQSLELLKTAANTNITSRSIRDYFGGGISPGDWQSLAYLCGKFLREQRENALGGSFASIWFKGTGTKESDFAKDTKTLVSLKNDYKHDRGPKTIQEYGQASDELQNLIDKCYAKIGFFIRHPIRIIEASDVEFYSGQPILDTLVYSGDHPGLRQERVTYPQILPKNILYIEMDKNNWSPLFPMCSVFYCTSCKTRETYFLDRWDGKGNRIVLKSFERGHTHENDKDAKHIENQFELWINRYLPS